MPAFPQNVNWGHLGVRSTAQFALMSPVTFAMQQVAVDQGDGTVVTYLSNGVSWLELPGGGGGGGGTIESTWGERPVPSDTNVGSILVATDWNNSQWISDGIDWRPLGVQTIVNWTQGFSVVNNASAFVFLPQTNDAGMLLPNCRMVVEVIHTSYMEAPASAGYPSMVRSYGLRTVGETPFAIPANSFASTSLTVDDTFAQPRIIKDVCTFDMFATQNLGMGVFTSINLRHNQTGGAITQTVPAGLVVPVAPLLDGVLELACSLGKTGGTGAEWSTLRWLINKVTVTIQA